MTRGRLITIEGIDGAGKTTLAIGLLDALAARGIEIGLLREPGGVAAAERIRELVIDPDCDVTARAEALLYAAARAQLVEEAIEPQLAAGRWLLLDRFIDSSLAYQGGGRRLGIDAVRAINEFAIRTARPDRTLLLMIDQRSRAAACARARGARPPRARAGRLLRADRRRVSRARLAGARADPARSTLAGARSGPGRGPPRPRRPTPRPI